ncbi:pyridoxine/pyridoxamine 5'-phosphate oxidase [Rhodococcus daqingensis]|uniref:Pyridoxal 5'-phosphate synthase n=1 Tax=Rhodococcus daqingensis TaxID=2479363 RepID=A0ABW2RY05_9NOCA
MSDIAPRSTFADTRAWLRALPAATAAAAADGVLDPALAPSELFLRWLEDAVVAGVPDPQAAVLSTVDDGRADARVLTLKDVDERGWWFSGSANSPKGRQLAANPAAALTFYWAGVGRQVRVRGAVATADPEVSARDYLDRSVTARAVAAASRQSEVLADPVVYDGAVAGELARIEADPGRVAATWQAWCLVPDSVEFWLADPGRRHQRLRYRRPAPTAGWITDVLWP